jgi:hypothetical protein
VCGDPKLTDTPLRWQIGPLLHLVDRSTLIDPMIESTKRRSPETHVNPRKIVGFSLDPDLAREVKAIAAERGLSLKKLFMEMWSVYKKHGVARR